jgi:hypothetical protein
MRGRRRPVILQRVPIFFGCEGESEQAYGQVLNDLLREANRPFHLEVVNLNPGAGDPIARLRRAEQEIARRRLRRAEFRLKVVLMDSDQVAADARRRQQAEQLARDFDIRIIWQEPCHEAILLRHLDGFDRNRPPTSADAEAALRGAWPDYRKPMTKVQLARRIVLDAVRRAAAVEPSLSEFFHYIKLLP